VECGYRISGKPFYQNGLAFCSQECAEIATGLNLESEDYSPDNEPGEPYLEEEEIFSDVPEALGIDSFSNY